MWPVNLRAALRPGLLKTCRRYPVALARLRGALSRQPLPPGDYAALDSMERADRDALRKRAEALGPVFKGIAWGELSVCIIGLDRGRRCTRKQRADLRVMSMELKQFDLVGAVDGTVGEHLPPARSPAAGSAGI